MLEAVVRASEEVRIACRTEEGGGRATAMACEVVEGSRETRVERRRGKKDLNTCIEYSSRKVKKRKDTPSQNGVVPKTCPVFFVLSLELRNRSAAVADRSRMYSHSELRHN